MPLGLQLLIYGAGIACFRPTNNVSLGFAVLVIFLARVFVDVSKKSTLLLMLGVLTLVGIGFSLLFNVKEISRTGVICLISLSVVGGATGSLTVSARRTAGTRALGAICGAIAAFCTLASVLILYHYFQPLWEGTITLSWLCGQIPSLAIEWLTGYMGLGTCLLALGSSQVQRS